MAKRNQQVVPHDGEWGVWGVGSQCEAIDAAQEIAWNQSRDKTRSRAV